MGDAVDDALPSAAEAASSSSSAAPTGTTAAASPVAPADAAITDAEEAAPQPASATPPFPPPGVPYGTVCCSGGGFRATLFHLGMLRYLVETKRINDETEIFGVSGGSVLVAYVGLHRDMLDQKRFAERAQKVVDFVARDMRGHLFGKWLAWNTALLLLLPLLAAMVVGVFTASTWICCGAGALVFGSLFLVRLFVFYNLARVAFLEAEYERLYESARLDKLHTAVRILFTNLTKGDVGWYFRDGLTMQKYVRRRVKPAVEVHVALGNYSVARAAAASSAFPPGFAPVRYSPPRRLENDAHEYFGATHLFTDGGVFDNLGAFTATRMPLLISDAERPFILEESEFRWLYSRANRAIDILMRRATETPPQCAVMPALQDYASWPGENSGKAKEWQNRLQVIRTDLDAFSPVEIQTLVFQGYVAAANAHGELDKLSSFAYTGNGIPYVPKNSTEHWLPYPVERIAQGKLEDLDKSHRVRVWTHALRIYAAAILVSHAAIIAVTAWFLMAWHRSPPVTLGTPISFHVASALDPTPEEQKLRDEAIGNLFQQDVDRSLLELVFEKVQVHRPLGPNLDFVIVSPARTPTSVWSGDPVGAHYVLEIASRADQGLQPFDAHVFVVESTDGGGLKWEAIPTVRSANGTRLEFRLPPLSGSKRVLVVGGVDKSKLDPIHTYPSAKWELRIAPDP